MKDLFKLELALKLYRCLYVYRWGLDMKIKKISLLILLVTFSTNVWANKKSEMYMADFDFLLKSKLNVVEVKTDSILYQFADLAGVGYIFGDHVGDLYCKALGHINLRSKTSYPLVNNPPTILKLDVAFEAQKYFQTSHKTEKVALKPQDLRSYGGESENNVDFSNAIGPEFEFSVSFTKEHSVGLFDRMTSKFKSQIDSDLEPKENPDLSLVVRLKYAEIDPNDVEQSTLAIDKFSCRK